MSGKRGRPALILGTLTAKLQLISGIAIAFLFGLAMIGCFTLEEGFSLPTFVLALVLFLVGVWLIWRSHKKTVLIKRFKLYSATLANDPIHSLDALALIQNLSLDQVRRDVEQMVRQGLFASAYINYETNCLVLAGQDAAPAPAGPSAPSAGGGGTARTVKCPGCGANNRVVPGGAAECEFCGTKL